MDDIVEKLFKSDYIRAKEKFIEKIELIRQQLLKCESDVKIDCYNIGIVDIAQKEQDTNYLSNYNLKYIDNGISSLYFDSEMFDLIKDYIPKAITKLEIPLEFFMSNLDFFKMFPNLKTLVINDYKQLDKDDFDKILTDSNIREILCKNIISYSRYYEQGDFVNASFPYNCLCYKDIMMSSTDDKMNRSSSRLTILSSDFNQQNFERIYDKFKGNKKINEVNIMLNNGHSYEIKFLNERTIDSIVINDGNIGVINKFYNYLVNKDYEINNIIIDVVDINYEDIDLSNLKKIKEESNITFKYSTLDKANFDDFLGLVEAMKWYRSMIDDEMSPAEKLMFAYDILKTFEYHENKYNKDNARAPHNIIRGGDIVCVGYTNLLREILKNKDDNLKVGAVSVTCYDKNEECLGNHSQGLVSIDDDKYDIHGIFIDDPTWDSYNEKRKYSLGKAYNALDLYQYFLIPKADYKKVFPYDSIPNIFNKSIEAADKGERSTTLSLVNEYNMALYDNVLKNKDNISNEEIENRINMARRPSLATFNEILYNVRLKEGYSSNQAHDDINRVNKENIDLSIMVSELDENNFFKDSKDTINKK